jgi:hypothetical protein
MKKAVLCFALLIGLAAVGVAQLPTVTNETLEKYKRERLAALRDYRENYARLGFPSPEELDRQREADMNARIDLADQLRQARLEEEKIALQSRSIDLQADALAIQAEMAYREAPVEQVGGYYGGYGTGYYGGNGGYYSDPYGYYNGGIFGGRDRRYDRRYNRRNNGIGIWPNYGGYRSTPVGVYPNSGGIPLPAIRRRPWGR